MQVVVFLIFTLVFISSGIKHLNDVDQEVISVLQISSNIQSQVNEQYNWFQQTELGKMFMDFALVEMQVTGAVDTLMETMKAFGRQIEDRLQKEQEIFDARQGEHTSKILQIESLINQAELDINRERKRLNQELIPRSAELDDVLLGLKAKKENNNEAVSQAKMARKDQNNAFNMQANEVSEAIRAVDEALEQIKQMMNNNSGTNFIQLSNDDKIIIQKRLHNIQIRAEKVGKFFGSFLQALSQLSESQNFADRQVIKQLVDLLNSLRSSFVETLQKAYADEDQQKMLFDQRIQQLQKELEVFEKQYGEAIQEREEKSIRIQDTQNVIQTRSVDLKGYEERLSTENNNYSMNQKIHDDLVASINEEIGVIEKALDLMASPSMQDILQLAMNKAR